jgi:hypothetical protein
MVKPKHEIRDSRFNIFGMVDRIIRHAAKGIKAESGIPHARRQEAGTQMKGFGANTNHLATQREVGKLCKARLSPHD